MRIAYSRKEGGSMAAHSSVSTAVAASPSTSKSAAWRQPNTTILWAPVSAPILRCSSRRSVATGVCGISMPETIASPRRKGVAEGQAPTQMPHAAHRALSTWACAGCRLASVRATMVTAPNGQSATQREQPLQLAGSTRAATRGRSSRAGSKGSSANASVSTATSNHALWADNRSTKGCTNW